MANGFKQKCWTCKHASNRDSCIWVASLKTTPNGCIKDNQGYIVFCPQYEHDLKIYNKQDEIHSLGLNRNSYRSLKARIKKLNLNISVKDYIEKINKETKELKITQQQYISIEKTIRRYNLNITPKEFIKITNNNKNKIKKLIKENKTNDI